MIRAGKIVIRAGKKIVIRAGKIVIRAGKIVIRAGRIVIRAGKLCCDWVVVIRVGKSNYSSVSCHSISPLCRKQLTIFDCNQEQIFPEEDFIQARNSAEDRQLYLTVFENRFSRRRCYSISCLC